MTTNITLIPVLAVRGYRLRNSDSWVKLPASQLYIASDLKPSWDNSIRDLIKHKQTLPGLPAGCFPLAITGLFRPREKQEELYAEYITAMEVRKKQKKGSEPKPVAKPGSSWHEAGRAFDFDTKNKAYDYATVIEIMAGHGWCHYLPDGEKIEPWHLDHRAPFKSPTEAITALREAT